MNLTKNKNKIIFYTTLIIILLFTSIYMAHSYLEMKKGYIYSLEENKTLKSEINKKSEIEKIGDEILNYKKESEKYKKLQEEAKKKYEISTWKLRCFENNLLLEAKKEKLEDCTNNLERFASYNLKK